jgi:protein TonB
MELKKSPKADLESKKSIFVQIGLVLALGICLYGFEATDKVSQVDTLGSMDGQAVEEEIIPITRQEEVKPPPPPPPPKVVDMLVIVDDKTEIDEELEIEDTEVNDKTAITAVMQVNNKEEVEEAAEVFFIVEEMPEFPGGDAALRAYIAQSVKYPTIAMENGIQGKVYVNFVVGKDGSISNAKIARGVDPSLDKEALRVVNSLPKWKPGKQGGKAVRVSYTVPINFVLQ